MLAPLYAFAKASLSVKQNSSGESNRFHCDDGYYDSVNQEIVLRKVPELQGGDILINLKTGEVKKFFNY